MEYNVLNAYLWNLNRDAGLRSAEGGRGAATGKWRKIKLEKKSILLSVEMGKSLPQTFSVARNVLKSGIMPFRCRIQISHVSCPHTRRTHDQRHTRRIKILKSEKKKNNTKSKAYRLVHLWTQHNVTSAPAVLFILYEHIWVISLSIW